MKTVQMTLEPELVAEVDSAARRLGTTRSGFARRALRQALERLRMEDLERPGEVRWYRFARRAIAP